MKNAQLLLLVVVVLAALLAAEAVAIRQRSNTQISDSELASNSSVCYW